MYNIPKTTEAAEIPARRRDLYVFEGEANGGMTKMVSVTFASGTLPLITNDPDDLDLYKSIATSIARSNNILIRLIRYKAEGAEELAAYGPEQS